MQLLTGSLRNNVNKDLLEIAARSSENMQNMLLI